MYLAPHQHGAKDDLQAVEEVVPNEDDGGAAGGPAFARADGFDAGRGCFGDDTTGQQREPPVTRSQKPKYTKKLLALA